MRDKWMDKKWPTYVMGILAVISLGLLLRLVPYSEETIVGRLDKGDDVIGTRMKFTPTDVVRNTAIGDVLHTESGKVAIQSTGGKYWNIGESYSYEIVNVEEMLGVYIITIDNGIGDDK